MVLMLWRRVPYVVLTPEGLVHCRHNGPWVIPWLTGEIRAWPAGYRQMSGAVPTLPQDYRQELITARVRMGAAHGDHGLHRRRAAGEARSVLPSEPAGRPSRAEQLTSL